MKCLKAALVSGTAISAGLAAAPYLGAVAPAFAPVALARAQSPCAARNPCAPGRTAASGSDCVVPRLQQAAANPCAAKANPCAAKANPCAAQANPCNPCNPCAAAADIELEDHEAMAVYDCLLESMRAAYAKAGLAAAKAYPQWARYSTRPYQSATHGGRFVHNYADDRAKAYGRFEKAGAMPPGAQIAKDSFVVHPNGATEIGPLFLMEKMQAGFNAESGDWKYTMIMPDGTVFGQTKGANAEGMAFCAQCHAAAAENDHLFFLPAEHRAAR